jgi:hypothetical protein
MHIRDSGWFAANIPKSDKEGAKAMNLDTLINTPSIEWPEGTGKLLLKTMVDRDATQDDRIIAAELAADISVMDDAMADALVSVTSNPEESEELRATAAISLGPILELFSTHADDPEFPEIPITEYTFRNVQELLERLYFDKSNSKEVRRRILEAVVHAPEVWHKTAIQEAWASDDKEWKTTAVFAMRWVQGFDEQIMQALQSSDEDIFYEAIKAAGNWGLEAAWPVIVRLLTKSGTPKRLLLAAIEASGNIHPDKAPGLLMGFLDSTDDEIADTAAEAVSLARVLSGEALEEEEDAEEESEEERPTEWIN